MWAIPVLLRHPEVATLDCDACRDWVRDDRWNIVTRGGQPQRNVARVGPCHRGPKRNPAEAPRYELSLKNIRAVGFYYRVRAMRLRNLDDSQATDGTLVSNMAIIDRIIRHLEQELACERVLAAVPTPTIGQGT